MKLAMRLWLIIFGIIIAWIYFIFISPKIFNNTIVTIPNVVSLTEEEAIKKLDDQHISYQITYIEDKEEYVKKTIPHAGTNIKQNNVVKVYIGKIMPASYRSYLGLVFEDVKDEIELMCNNYGLTLKIGYEETPNAMGGIIIKESLVDGSILNKGDELSMTISSNINSYLMPDFVGLRIDEALKLIEEYSLKVHLTYLATPIDEDIILFQSTPPNTLIHKNNPYTLDLYISKGIKETSVIHVDQFIEVIQHLGYELEINYVKSNELENKLVAFQVQKLYDNNIVKYILWITK